MCCSISDGTWSQATLPFWLGGLGLHDSECSANLVDITQILVSHDHLVGSSDASVPLPREECMCSIIL